MIFWLFLTLFCVVVQGFYSMLEMASVSYNRIRLEYEVSRGSKRAKWLSHLLEHPSRLFGTIMLGVNIALQVGSQSSRELYQTLHLDPTIAPITQVILVVIFAELAPLFAARRHAEQVVMLGIPIVYATYRLLSPLIWLIGLLTRLFAWVVGSKEKDFDVLFSRDELQRVIEEREEEGDDFQFIVSNIFTLKKRVARDLMQPLQTIPKLPANARVADIRRLGKVAQIPLYHKRPTHIVAIASSRDLLRLPDHKRIRDYAKPPWFLPQETPLMQIMRQFRRNQQTVAVVLDHKGSAVGLLTLDALFEEIFGAGQPLPLSHDALIERSFPGNTRIVDFNHECSASLPTTEVETLAQLFVATCGHHPEKGESITIDRFEFTAEETTLLGIKTLFVRSSEVSGSSSRET